MMTDASALALYRRVWGEVPSSQMTEVAGEVRRMLTAPTHEDAVAVVAWWVEGQNADAIRRLRRDVARLRRIGRTAR